MPNQNADMAALIAEICGGVAAPWRERITASHSPAEAACAHRGADRFRNPRGFIINDTIDGVLSGITGSSDRAGMKTALETFMKIQALEAPSPEEAVDFLRQLKSLVREASRHDRDRIMTEAVREMESLIDDWITVATGMYHENRALLPALRQQENRRTEIRNLKKQENRVDPSHREVPQ